MTGRLGYKMIINKCISLGSFRSQKNRLAFDRDKLMNLEIGLWFSGNLEFFYGLGMTNGYKLDHWTTHYQKDS